MSCSGSDLKACALGEGTREERRAVRAHAAGCAACREELSRLEAANAALLCLRDEEVPRRIAFVSDREIAPAWWQFWRALPRLAVPALALLAIAVSASALYRQRTPPVTVVLTAPVPAATLTAGGTDVDRRIQNAVAEAMEQAEARQQQRTAELLAAADRKHQMDLRAMQVAFEEDWRVKMKQLGTLYVAVNRMDAGGER